MSPKQRLLVKHSEYLKMFHQNHRSIQPAVDNRRPSIHSISGVIQPGSPEIISLLIGPTPSPIAISRLSIWTHIPVLIEHIDRTFPSSPFIHLPLEDPYSWCIVAYWADQGQLPPLLDAMVIKTRNNNTAASAAIVDEEADRINTPDLLVDIYAVATRFCIEGLQAAALNALEYVHLLRPDPTLPSCGAFNTAWAVTRGRQNQGIRRMFRDWCLSFMRRGLVGADVLDGLSDEVVVELWLMKGMVGRICWAREYWEGGRVLIREGWLMETGALVRFEWFWGGV